MGPGATSCLCVGLGGACAQQARSPAALLLECTFRAERHFNAHHYGITNLTILRSEDARKRIPSEVYSDRRTSQVSPEDHGTGYLGRTGQKDELGDESMLRYMRQVEHAEGVLLQRRRH